MGKKVIIHCKYYFLFWHCLIFLIGFLGGLPGQLSAIPRQKEMTPGSEAGSSEYEYYYEDEEEDSGSAPR